MGLNDGEFMRWWVMTSRWRDMDGWMNEAHIILLPDVVMNRDSKQDEINLIEPVKSNLICIYSPLIQWLIGTRDKCIIYQLHPVFLSLTVNKVVVSLELSFQSNVNQKYSSFSEPKSNLTCINSPIKQWQMAKQDKYVIYRALWVPFPWFRITDAQISLWNMV